MEGHAAKKARTEGGAAGGAAAAAESAEGAQMSAALAPYAAAFCGAGAGGAPFLAYHAKTAAGMETRRFTRAELWAVARQAAGALAARGLGKGDCVTHYFTENSHLDLVFRLAATMVGCVPVTVNWQADTPERVVYKISATASKLLLTDAGVPKEVLALAQAELPAVGPHPYPLPIVTRPA